MSLRAPALAAALLVACGARRAPPEPVFVGPIAVDVADFGWTDAGLGATLGVRNTSGFSLFVESLDWSVGRTQVEAQPVARSLEPGGRITIPLGHPGPPPAPPGAPWVAGTVHIRAPGGIRRAEVFRVAVPTSSLETL